MNSTEERLTRIETKLDMFIATQRDHETRIRVLEQWKWRVTGMALAASGVVSLCVSLITKFA